MRVRSSLPTLAVLALALFPQAATLAASAPPDHQSITPPLRTGGPHSTGYRRMLSFPRRPIQLHVPRLGRDVQRIVLKNGMILYMLEDHRLPIVRISALIRAGTNFVPRDQEVAMSMLGRQLRQGGTTSHTFEQLNDELEFMGASIETSTGGDQSGASLDVLTRDVDRGVKLFADVLMHPAFDPHQLDIAKGLSVEGIRRRNDRPGTIASRYFTRLLYTMEHPAGRAGFTTIAQVQGVTRDQLLALHHRYYGPNNAWLAVVGDFQRDKMIARLEDAFAGWEPVNAEQIAQVKQHLPRASGKNEPGVFLIHRPLPQATVVLGQFGVDRTNPDRFALVVMNQILGGGGFSSRIMDKVRTQQGLAYDVYTALDAGGRDLGTFRAVLQTKTSSVGTAIHGILEEIRRIQREPVSQRELQLVKDRIVNSFIFQFDTPLTNVTQLMQLEYDGRPSNYFETLLDKYRAVTPQDILRVAKKYLHPDQLAFLIVGDVRDSDAQWRQLGKVTALTLDDPLASAPRPAGAP